MNFFTRAKPVLHTHSPWRVLPKVPPFPQFHDSSLISKPKGGNFQGFSLISTQKGGSFPLSQPCISIPSNFQQNVRFYHVDHLKIQPFRVKVQGLYQKIVPFLVSSKVVIHYDSNLKLVYTVLNCLLFNRSQGKLVDSFLWCDVLSLHSPSSRDFLHLFRKFKFLQKQNNSQSKMGFFSRSKPVLRPLINTHFPSRNSSSIIPLIHGSSSNSAEKGFRVHGFSPNSPIFFTRYQNTRFYHQEHRNLQFFREKVLTFYKNPSYFLQSQLVILGSVILIMLNADEKMLKVLIFVLLTSGSHFFAFYLANSEMIPYTKRTHFLLLPLHFERGMANILWNHRKEILDGNILPVTHSSSLRVRSIFENIIDALRRGVWLKEAWNEDASVKSQAEKVICYLDELDWEILVLEDHISVRKLTVPASVFEFFSSDEEKLIVPTGVVESFSGDAEKIAVPIGVLKSFPSDAEIAFLIAHEVAHVVARHYTEGLTREFLLHPLEIMTFGLTNKILTRRVRRPSNYRMRFEADYIAMLLIASAGYDPRVATEVYEKFSKIDWNLGGDPSTNPSVKERVEMLSQPKVLEEAMVIYRESKNRETA